MLDINLIREHSEWVQKRLHDKQYDVDFTEFLERDARRRELIYQVEQLKAEKNKVSAAIPQMKKAGQDVTETLARMKTVSEDVRRLDDELGALERTQQEFLEALPNLPADDVIAGGKENNKVVRAFGAPPTFGFKPCHHVDIAERLRLIDYTRGAKLGGSGFWIYRGDGALIEWALINYFMEEHLKDGYEMILPPHILNYACGYTAGQFPKFRDDVFQLRRDDGTGEGAGAGSGGAAGSGEGFTHFILPTAETALVNLYRDEILDEDDLPKKLFAYTPCYRKEAGSYRAEERGMIRGHQFNKIELFQYTLPEKSDAALDELIDKACRLVEGLGLHYRLSKLAAADCSAAMRKTFDIEVWIPSMNDYKEVSSASNAGDYQARRGNIRFRRHVSNRLEFAHTLNASGLATSRILPAILEQYQQADGTVLIPEVLRKWMGGREVLGTPEG